MPILWTDLETLVEDIRDDIGRVRRMSEAAYALAIAVKSEVAPTDAALLARDEKWRGELSSLVDAVLEQMAPRRLT